jgi:hypothetical protein
MDSFYLKRKVGDGLSEKVTLGLITRNTLLKYSSMREQPSGHHPLGIHDSVQLVGCPYRREGRGPEEFERDDF